MRKFVLGFFTAVASFVGLLIFLINKAAYKAAKETDFKPLQNFISGFNKKIVDILLYGHVIHEKSVSERDHAQKPRCDSLEHENDTQYFIDEDEVGGDGIYQKEYYNYFYGTGKLIFRGFSDGSNDCVMEVECPVWLDDMLNGYVEGYTYGNKGRFPEEGERVYIRDQEEDKDYIVSIITAHD